MTKSQNPTFGSEASRVKTSLLLEWVKEMDLEAASPDCFMSLLDWLETASPELFFSKTLRAYLNRPWFPRRLGASGSDAAQMKLPLEMGVLSFVQNVDKELRNGGKASTCGIHAGI